MSQQKHELLSVDFNAVTIFTNPQNFADKTCQL